MKRLFIYISFLLVGLNYLQAQIYDPVEWKTEVEKIPNSEEYELKIIAAIEPGWHLYSQDVPPNGPIPTSFKFQPDERFEIIGKVEEKEGHVIQDPVFEMEIKFFSDKTTFTQKIRSQSGEPFTIEGSVNFMVCDDQRCLPPETKKFEFFIPAVPSQKAEKSTEKKSETRVKSGKEESKNDGSSAVGIKEEKKEDVSDKADALKITNLPSKDAVKENNDQIAPEVKKESLKENKGNKDNDNLKEEDDQGLWMIFLIAFFSGFAALLTPCVFPMIPLTVSFFTKQSKNKVIGIRNAIFYGLSIIVIYVLLGSLVTLIFGADALNALSTNVWFNLIFFILLVVFAISFLGAFEIVLPSSWGNKMDARANRGGMIGIFFMALALAIVSFSCTGPIVGTLLVQAASKGGFAPIVGMLGFSSAIAIPFALFAAFPGWLNSLPRSGGWLNTVKAVLGFLELALAFKFLSNADLVLQLHILERETFLAIWIAVFGVLAFYLFGKIKLPHDGPLPYISVGRLSLGVIVLAFTIYLIPGLWGAPLQWISGFPPPQQYSESPYGVGNSKGIVTSGESYLPENAELGPHDIPVFKDYSEGMDYAAKKNKPALLDFTGYACVNCRKMEERVWSDPKVLDLLKNQFVLISLYVDDKKELPEEEKYTSQVTGKNIETIGNKWSDYQIEHFQTNAQPYYVMVDNTGTPLIDPIAYEPDIEKYRNWLKKGIESFNNK